MKIIFSDRLIIGYNDTHLAAIAHSDIEDVATLPEIRKILKKGLEKAGRRSAGQSTGL